MAKDNFAVLDFRRRRFFRTTRAVVNNDNVLTKPVEIAVYTVLCMYADNNDTTSHPSVSTIAKKARCSERVVHRTLRTLEEVGYIKINNRTDSRGFKTSNQYVLLDVPDE